jgi:uncharacterized protein
VKNPADVVKVHQKVMVTVMEVDLKRKRIALSMKSKPEKEQQTTEKTKPKVKSREIRPGNRTKRAECTRPPQKVGAFGDLRAKLLQKQKDLKA